MDQHRFDDLARALARTASRRQTLWAIAGGGLAVLCGLGRGKPTAAKNLVVVDKAFKTIVITVQIDVVLMPGVEPGAVQTLLDGFAYFWGARNGFRYKCYDVLLQVDVEVLHAPDLPPDDAARHRAIIHHTDNPGPISHVDYGKDRRNYDPTRDSIEGRWYDWDAAVAYAHEIGHFLGLPDEYTYTDKNKNRRRDQDEPAVPDPAKRDSLMCDLGRVRQRYIDEIVREHVKGEPADPCDKANCEACRPALANPPSAQMTMTCRSTCAPGTTCDGAGNCVSDEDEPCGLDPRCGGDLHCAPCR
jgi:hypothetical protein